MMLQTVRLSEQKDQIMIRRTDKLLLGEWTFHRSWCGRPETPVQLEVKPGTASATLGQHWPQAGPAFVTGNWTPSTFWRLPSGHLCISLPAPIPFLLVISRLRSTLGRVTRCGRWLIPFSSCLFYKTPDSWGVDSRRKLIHAVKLETFAENQSFVNLLVLMTTEYNVIWYLFIYYFILVIIYLGIWNSQKEP